MSTGTDEGSGMQASREPVLDARALRYFIAVAEERHFGRAARRLNIAQPPLSQQIQRLERALGVQLLVRTTRRVELTAAGEVLLAEGRHVVDDLRTIESTIRRIGAGLGGTLRAGFTGSATYALMPAVLRLSHEALGDVELLVSGEQLTPGLESELTARRLDVAVLRLPVASPELEVEHLATEPLIAAISEGSPLCSKDEITLDDLLRTPLVGYPENSAVSAILTRAAKELGGTLHYAQRIPETSSVLSLVAGGVGAAIVPASASAVRLDGIRFRAIENAPTVALAIAWRVDSTNPAVARFIPLVRAAVAAADAGFTLPGDERRTV